LETSEAAADDDYSMWFLCCGHGCHSATEPASSHRRDRQYAHPMAHPFHHHSGGVGFRLYTIDNMAGRSTRKHWYRHPSHQRTAEPGSSSLRLAI